MPTQALNAIAVSSSLAPVVGESSYTNPSGSAFSTSSGLVFALASGYGSLGNNAAINLDDANVQGVSQKFTWASLVNDMLAFDAPSYWDFSGITSGWQTVGTASRYYMLRIAAGAYAPLSSVINAGPATISIIAGATRDYPAGGPMCIPWDNQYLTCVETMIARLATALTTSPSGVSSPYDDIWAIQMTGCGVVSEMILPQDYDFQLGLALASEWLDATPLSAGGPQYSARSFNYLLLGAWKRVIQAWVTNFSAALFPNTRLILDLDEPVGGSSLGGAGNHLLPLLDWMKATYGSDHRVSVQCNFLSSSTKAGVSTRWHIRDSRQWTKVGYQPSGPWGNGPYTVADATSYISAIKADGCDYAELFGSDISCPIMYSTAPATAAPPGKPALTAGRYRYTVTYLRASNGNESPSGSDPVTVISDNATLATVGSGQIVAIKLTPTALGLSGAATPYDSINIYRSYNEGDFQLLTPAPVIPSVGGDGKWTIYDHGARSLATVGGSYVLAPAGGYGSQVATY